MPVRVRVSPSAPIPCFYQQRMQSATTSLTMMPNELAPIIERPYNFALVAAGWSSLVARRAHNPKVVGSNPAPATTTIGLHWSLNASIAHRVPTRNGLG